jgi:hypothetical protein
VVQYLHNKWVAISSVLDASELSSGQSLNWSLHMEASGSPSESRLSVNVLDLAFAGN